MPPEKKKTTVEIMKEKSRLRLENLVLADAEKLNRKMIREELADELLLKLKEKSYNALFDELSGFDELGIKWVHVEKHGTMQLSWNCEHLCWDGADEDDISDYDKDVMHWIPLPEFRALRTGGKV